MRRTHTAAEDHAEWWTPEASTALIARLSAEHDVSPAEAVVGHRRHSAATVVTRDGAPNGRTGIRRLAPVAVGAVVMLVATLVLTTVRAPQPAAAVDQAADAQTVAAAAPTGAGTQAPLPSTSPVAPITTTVAAKAKPAAAKPPAPARPVVGSGIGVSAAAVRGWTLATADEFNGTTLNGNWGPYDGAGNGGKGRRAPDAITVKSGILTIRGDSKGTTGGMAWADDQRFGKWEVRARFPKGDEQYHPVLLLWPQGEWPAGGEVDFAETTSASSGVEFFLHYSSSNKQKSAQKPLDLTQWHNYAVEWVNGRITGYIDGQQWFQSTDASTLPPGQMHLAIQLDYFPKGGSPSPTEMDVDYVRIYK